MQFEHVLNLDIESFSDISISLGTFKYAERAIPLILAYSLDDAPVVEIDLTKQCLPAEIKRLLTDRKTLKRAYNAAFERTVLSIYYNIELPPDQWECTMIRATMCGLPMSLDQSSKALGLTDNKDVEGKKLIMLFCVPCKATEANGMRTRNLPEHYPAEWQKFMRYCGQDVIVEKAVFNACKWFPISASEKHLWNLDQLINARGIRVDTRLAKNAILLDMVAREKLTKRAVEITGLANPNSPAQIKQWIEDNEYQRVISLNKQHLTELMKVFTDKDTLEVLKIRSELSKTSVKKYATMLGCIGSDARMRGLIQHYGAGRTGRFAGRLVQPHNFPRISLEGADLDMLRNFALQNSAEDIEFYFGSVTKSLSELLRTACIPAEDHKFIVSDFSAIEAVVLSWLAGETWRLDVFKTHGKIYEASAAQMFKKRVEDVTSDERQAGKVAELACGYQGGPDALWRMIEGEKAKGKKIELTEEELLPIIKAWRFANKNIVKIWYDLQAAAVLCLKLGDSVTVAKGLTFHYRNRCLLMELPSGRMLCYQEAGITTQKYWKVTNTEILTKGEYPDIIINKKKLTDTFFVKPNENKIITDGYFMYQGKKLLVSITEEIATREVIFFSDINQTTRKWEKNYTYGGKLCENAVQAIARDLLAEAIFNLEAEGYPLVLHVHDEVVCEVPLDFGSEEEVTALMTHLPEWATGMPVKAKTFTTMYYKKD